MGVADNKSYKNMYHFSERYNHLAKGDVPSVEVEPTINTTIKENPYRANVNIEKDEVILQPDLSALFKAKGKKHSGGGIDVNLKPDSFIFSDDKTLALTKNECELFEFEPYDKKGPHRTKDYTPAKVLKKHIDIEHYNRIVNNLDDPKKDDLAKKSSLMMLEKYVQTLGNIAYVQEAKKDFPTGIPDFAIGTAPVYDTQLKDDIMEQKQYAKYGGSVDNPYREMQLGGMVGSMLANYEEDIRRNALRNRSRARYKGSSTTETTTLPPTWGLWPGDKLPVFKDTYGVNNAADKIADLASLSAELGYTGPQNNKAFQEWLYNSSPKNKEIIDKWHQQYEDTGPIGGMFDGKIGIRWQNALDEIRRPRGPIPTLEAEPPAGNLGELRPRTPVAIDNIPHPNDVTGDPQGRKNADWQFTPWQKLSQGYNLAKYANLKRYMPYRSHLNPSYVDPYLVNPEQVIGDLKSGTNAAIGSLDSLNPILRNAQAASTFGQYLDRVPGVRSQYDNQNQSIIANTRAQNNQIANNARGVNMQNDQQYYQQSVVGRQNFDNAKTFAADQYMNNLLRDVETNQSLAYRMLTVNNPAYGFDFKQGNFYRNPVDIRDVNNSAQGDYLGSLLQNIDFKSLSNAEKIQYIRELQRGKALQYLNPSFGQTPPPFKKGGTNPYRR